MERKKGTSQFPRSWLSLETAATLSIFWTRLNNLIASFFHLASGNYFLRCCCQSPNSSILYALDPTTPTTFASSPTALERSPHRWQQTWCIILVPFVWLESVGDGIQHQFTGCHRTHTKKKTCNRMSLSVFMELYLLKSETGCCCRRINMPHCL